MLKSILQKIKVINSEPTLRSRDSLTELYSHNSFYDILQKKVEMEKDFSLLMIDVDNFKLFNMSQGFLKGDKILKGIAEALVQTIRGTDYAFRYEGDEFAVLLPYAGKKEAQSIANRISAIIKNTLNENNLGVSIGIASYPDDANNLEELVKYARLAQYKCRSEEKGEAVSYSGILDIIDSDLELSEYADISTIKTLINVVNIKDKYTHGHSKRVAKYSYLIGREVGLGSQQLTDLSLSAYLHDIGKINIDEEILCKPGKLTESEFRKIKKHPEYAAEIIKPNKDLRRLIPGIVQHHERYDGRGYPYGLSKGEIALEGKIIQIADCFDAMTTKRPYQPQKNYYEALQEIKRCSGTQFDPEVVACFNIAVEKSRK